MDELGEDVDPGQRAEAHAPSSAMLVMRAGEMNDVGRHDLAEDFARRALALEPRNARALLQLALAAQGRDDHRGAAKLAEQVLELEPEFAMAFGVLSQARTELGSFAQAERDVLEALRLDPDQPYFYRVYALLLFRAGKLEKAEHLLRRSLELDPDSTHANGLLALVLGERKKRAASLRHGRKSLALDPDLQFSHTALGMALLDSGHPFQARRHLREALSLEPDADAEQRFLYADRMCRVVYLPMYWWSLALRRVPGRNIGAWVLLMLVVFLGPALGMPPKLAGVIALGYFALCVYTWISTPLVKLWVKLLPPR